MHAIKLEVIVPDDRQLTITLPSEIPPGKAEVIVLSPALRYARFLTPLLSKTPDSQN